MWTDEGEGKVLYVQTHGVSDPGRCATPFFLAASAAAMEVEVGHLLHDVRPDAPAEGRDRQDRPEGRRRACRCRYFVKQATDLGVRLYVCQPSLELNDLALEDLIDGVEMIGGAAFNDMAMRADAVVSF